MATSTMPKPNEALRDFFANNEIFAALFNDYFFEEEVIRADSLVPVDSAYTETVRNGKAMQKINKYRDIIRRTQSECLIIMAIEEQDKIHYAMPLRCMLYDALGYSDELSAISKTSEKAKWTVDEKLSTVSKNTRVTPIVTIVFYTGEKAWDGPRSLHDMMDIDERTKEFVPDYQMHLVDLGHDDGITFKNPVLEELRYILHSIYSGYAMRDKREVHNSTISLAGILANDESLYRIANENQGGKIEMCQVLEERDKIIFREKDELIEKQYLIIEAKDQAIEEKDQAIEAKDQAIEELEKELQLLREKMRKAGISFEDEI